MGAVRLNYEASTPQGLLLPAPLWTVLNYL